MENAAADMIKAISGILFIQTKTHEGVYFSGDRLQENHLYEFPFKGFADFYINSLFRVLPHIREQSIYNGSDAEHQGTKPERVHCHLKDRRRIWK